MWPDGIWPGLTRGVETVDDDLGASKPQHGRRAAAAAAAAAKLGGRLGERRQGEESGQLHGEDNSIPLGKPGRMCALGMGATGPRGNLRGGPAGSRRL